MFRIPQKLQVHFHPSYMLLEDNNIFGSIIYPISNQEYEIITKEKTKLIVKEILALLEVCEKT